MDAKEQYIETIFGHLHALKRGFAPKHFGGSSSGIGFSQASILFMLKDRQFVTNTEIAEHLSVSPSAATQFVDSLEAEGLVGREPDEIDRRVSIIRYTEKGAHYVDELRLKRHQQLQEIFGVLTEKELEQLVAITAKLSQKIREKAVA